MGIKLITDSTSYINEELAESLGIDKLSLYVTFNEDSYKEMEISNDDFYQKMEEFGIPTSSQPATGEMLELMEKNIKAGHDIVAVFISSKMSGTYQSALMVKDMLLEDYPEAKIEIIDSMSNSMQLGFSVIEGAKLAEAGGSFEEVIARVKHVNVASRFIFIPDNLDYLRKGGRIGGAKALLGNAFSLTPILTVKDGNADTLQTVRTKSRAKKVMLNQLMEDHEKYEVVEVAVHHINCIEEAEAFIESVKALIDVPVTIADIGPVIGVHVGPKAIGLAYFTKNKID